MIRSAVAVLCFIFASTAFAQAPQPARSAATQAVVPWAVSVVHTIDVHKMVEQMRAHGKYRVGVAGSAPPYFYNITTGLIVDDQGHVVTRLSNVDPMEKDHKLAVTTSNGTTFDAKLIGVDFATGFAVLDVPLLKAAVPKVPAAGNLASGAAVRILSSDVVSKSVTDTIYLSPSIAVSQGHVVDSMYSKARGALTLLSDNLLARCDSSVVVNPESQVVGMAQYAGFGRAYLYPLAMIRDTIARRVIDKKDNVPAGELGAFGISVAQLSDADAGLLGLQRKAGVVVQRVTAQGPAARAGLLPNDVIIRFDDFDIAGMADLKAVLAPLPAGREVLLRALRNQQALDIKAVLGPRPLTEPESILDSLDPTLGPAISEREQLQKRRDELGERYRAYLKGPASREANEAVREIMIEFRQILERLRELGPEPAAASASPEPTQKEYVGPDFTAEQVPRDVSFPIGFTARDLTPQLAAILQARGGVLISSVVAGSPADRAGLKAGDVIVTTHDAALASAAQLQSLFSNEHGTIKLALVRNKQVVAVSINIP
ncbi:MAG TPA: PDZ domain-containing protein [Blastocatellia bacterium]|nr:PDZ domain-containing protein [Blastocatellia bacterium]